MALSALPLFHRLAGRRVVVLGEGPAAAAKRRLVERAGGECCGEPEAHHARLAFVAIEDARLADAAAARLRGKGLLVNVTDRPELCDFIVPSLLERDPVLVAIGTAGASAGLAKHLRLRLEAILPPSLGRLAEVLFASRERLRQRYPDPTHRRRALDAALASAGPLDPLRDDAADRLEQWLRNESVQVPAQTVEIVLTSADPDDLTLRQARWLGEADTIAHGPGVPETILLRARADAVRRDLSDADPGRPGLTVALRLEQPGEV